MVARTGKRSAASGRFVGGGAATRVGLSAGGLARHEGIALRAPVSTDLTPTQQRVLGAVCYLRSAPASDIALAADLTVHVVRRALGDLRELRLVSAERGYGRAAGNVWTAAPLARTCARAGCNNPCDFAAPHWDGAYCGPRCQLVAEADAA